MKHKVTFTKKAMKSLFKLEKWLQQNIFLRLEALAAMPYAKNNNVAKLQGDNEFYRLRIGDYRVLYRIINPSATIEVIAIAHRREAYR